MTHPISQKISIAEVKNVVKVAAVPILSAFLRKNGKHDSISPVLEEPLKPPAGQRLDVVRCRAGGRIRRAPRQTGSGCLTLFENLVDYIFLKMPRLR